MRFLSAAILATASSVAVPAAAQEKRAAPPAADQAEKKPLNHLAGETSPYLLSHQHNPVDWYPWGPEALAKAKKANKPIFLSIGYSACHWCHVMERESFEDEEIAAVMNEHFVCIKVDREERPDLDEIYMAAVTRISGSGGWPMSVWLTPAGKPFWGGTYFPPEDKFGRPGFKRVCAMLGKAWAEQRERIEKDADSMATYLTQSLSPPAQWGELSMEFFAVAAANSVTRWDREHGGFGAAPAYAPKFPHASEISALLINHARHGDDASLRCAEQTLQKMARGGIYDHVGGGFHRYSTDRMWLVPHFEKMLYDNALLAQTYLDAFQHTGNPFYRRVATATLDYLLREMQDGKGGFHSTTDADSEGVEGKFFVWTKAEIDKLLAADAELFAAVYGVTGPGNWHEIPGATVLSEVMTEPAAAAKFGIPEAVVRERLAAARKVLYDARRTGRVPPLKDDKVLAAWNGMAIAALARGYLALGDVRYLQAAQAAARFVLTDMRQANGRLYRSWRGGKPKLEAYLDDYAYVADGLTLLFQCDFDPQWLAGARALLGVVATQFRDPKDGNFYFTANDHEELVARSKSVQEGSIPSGAALAIRAFVRAGLLLVDEKLVDIGRRALEANHGYLQRYPNHVVTMLSTCDLLLNDPREVVVAGPLEDPGTQAFLTKLRARWPAAYVVTVVHAGNAAALAELVPSHEHKVPRGGEPAAYVCKFGVCEAPVTKADELVLK